MRPRLSRATGLALALAFVVGVPVLAQQADSRRGAYRR